MELIAPDAEPYVDPDQLRQDWPSRAVALAEQSRAVEVLEREYGSWPRLLTGTVAVLSTSVGVALVGFGTLFAVTDDGSAGERALVLVVGALLGGAILWYGWRLGRRTVHAGRRVVDALVAWHRLPDTVAADGSFVPPELRRRGDAVSTGDRRRVDIRDAVHARTYVFRGPIFLRIAVAAVLMVAALMAWGTAIAASFVADEVDAGTVIQTAILAAIATIATVAMIYVWGGAYRVNAAHASRDPIAAGIVRGIRRIIGRPASSSSRSS